MTPDEALAALEAAGTGQNRKIYARHGFAAPMFGVSYANLGKLRKLIRRDQSLASALWKTGNHDAQLLAALVADPAAFDAVLLRDWARTAADYATVDSFAKEIAAKAPGARLLAAEWMDASSVIVQRGGWATAAALAIWGPVDLPDQWFLDLLPRIERDIHRSPNRVREAMNNTLMAIGIRNERLRGPATGVATRVGKVKVDHGETNCETPDAASYIDRAFARKASRAG